VMMIVDAMKVRCNALLNTSRRGVDFRALLT
jgi:hypothetical protein